MIRHVNDQQIGGVIRAVRIRRRWRQRDLASRANVSQTMISKIERGHLGGIQLDLIRRVCAALEIRVELEARWRGGELDRLRNARHSALHECVARSFALRSAWTIAPEVSFSIFGERGIIDLLAWNPDRQALLVIELKTAIVDVNELVGTFDRKIRLAREVAIERGWAVGPNISVSGWVIVADSRTNRRRLQDHAAVLRAAYPMDGRGIRRWLMEPTGSIRCLGFWREQEETRSVQRTTAVQRVRCRRTASIRGAI